MSNEVKPSVGIKPFICRLMIAGKQEHTDAIAVHGYEP